MEFRQSRRFGVWFEWKTPRETFRFSWFNTCCCFPSVAPTWPLRRSERSHGAAPCLLLRGSSHARCVCCIVYSSSCGLMEIRVGVCLVSSSLVLLNPGNICQEQRASHRYSWVQAFSLSVVRQWWHLPLKVAAWGLMGIFGPARMIVPDSVLGAKKLEMGKTLSLHLKGSQKQKEIQNKKIIIQSLFIKVYMKLYESE